MALAAKTGREKGRKTREFRRDESGVTIIEFALLAPIFFAIIAAIMQTAVVFLSGQVLESAVNDASRTIRTGMAQQESWSLANFRENVCGRLYGLIDCTGLHIEVSLVDNFQSARAEPPIDRNCTEDCGWSRDETWSPGIASSIVLVQVHSKFRLIVPTGPLSSSALPDGRLLLGAATVFRNEPF